MKLINEQFSRNIRNEKFKFFIIKKRRDENNKKKETNFNNNIIIERDERYRHFQYFINKLKKKNRYFKCLQFKYLLNEINVLYKNKSWLNKKQIIIILTKTKLKIKVNAFLIYKQ